MNYQNVPRVEEGQGGNAPVSTVYNIQVEKFRLYAYISFWGMCLFAIIMTRLTVANTLGPCPLTEGAEPTYGLHCSVLMATFGFNNICVNWDYSPAREATAMVYPIFEYLLIAYIIVDYLQIVNDYDNDRVSAGIKKSANILLWLKIVLIAWFRMIFVCTVLGEDIPIFGFELKSVVAHTLGFFGMQFGLILIAFQNVVYIYYKGVSMWGMSTDLTMKMAALYLVTLFVITCLKISWASSIFMYGTPWISGGWPKFFDRTWMLLAAFMPLLFAAHGIKTEPNMTIQITNTPRA